MNKMYQTAEDLNVVARLIYKKTNDLYAYADSAKTEKIDAKTLADLFTKGVLIVDGANQYKPSGLTVNAGVATLTYVTTDGAVATTAVMATLVSEEYEGA